MDDLANIDLSDLYDMLAQQTNRYMKMLSDGATKQEFDQCREMIISIQAEIQSRKNQRSQERDVISNTSFIPGYMNRPKNWNGHPVLYFPFLISPGDKRLQSVYHDYIV